MEEARGDPAGTLSWDNLHARPGTFTVISSDDNALIADALSITAITIAV